MKKKNIGHSIKFSSFSSFPLNSPSLSFYRAQHVLDVG